MKSNHKTHSLLSNISEVIADILYPKKCIVCGSFVNIGKRVSLCPRCLPRLNKYGKVVRDSDKYFEEAVCALEYSGCVRNAMSDYKFKGIRFLNETFAFVLYNKVKDRSFLDDVSFICPVPIHPLRDREYNQSQLIAECLGTMLEIKVYPDVLLKIKNVTPLSKMGYHMRKHSIKSAIAFNHQYNIAGKTVCLVDDIYTTGSTANECSRILRMHGAKKVYDLSSCYADDHNKGGNENADADISNQ